MLYFQNMLNNLNLNEIRFLLSDKVIFPFFELTLFIVFIYAWLVDNVLPNRRGAVQRGKEGRGIIVKVASAIISALVLEVINNTDVWKEYKVIVILTNLAILAYLCFFNSWFRNELVGLYIKFEKKVENF